MKRTTLIALACAAAAAGCATRPPPAGNPAPEAGGVIVRVNPRAHYAVAECSVLPSPREEATVFRGNQTVGRIRFTGEFRPPYAIADLVSGQVLAGDRWRRDGRDGPVPTEQEP